MKKSLDCSTMPSEKNCDVYMEGSAEHLESAAVAHAVADHGHQDTPELREEIKKGMKDAE